MGEEDTYISFRIEKDRIEPEKLFRAFRAFYELLTEVTQEVCGGKRKWLVSVKDESQGLICTPVDPKKTPSVQIRKAMCDGVVSLGKGTAVMPRFFSRRAISATHDLANVFPSKKGQPITRVSIGNGKARDSVSLSESIAANAGKFIAGQYTELGEVEGRLEVIDGHHGFSFRIYDDLGDFPINCESPNALEQEIRRQVVSPDAFGKRVIAGGLVSYTTDGHPVHIVVQSIRTMADEKDLPTEEDMKAVFRA